MPSVCVYPVCVCICVQGLAVTSCLWLSRARADGVLEGLSPSPPLCPAPTAVTVCCSAWREVEGCCMRRKVRVDGGWGGGNKIKWKQSHGTKSRSCQFVRSVTMFFSSQAKSHCEPIDWFVIYLLSVIMCVCVWGCVLSGDSWQKRRWQTMKRNITLTKKWRLPCGGQESCFSTVNLQRVWEWVREGVKTQIRGKYKVEGTGINTQWKEICWEKYIREKIEGVRKSLYSKERENTVTLVHREI